MSIHEFIKKRKHLIWWVKDYDKLSVASVVEATLNYGDWNDIQTLIRILGIKKIANIFYKKSNTRLARTNYSEKTKHFFTLYFKKHA